MNKKGEEEDEERTSEKNKPNCTTNRTQNLDRLRNDSISNFFMFMTVMMIVINSLIIPSIFMSTGTALLVQAAA